MKNPPNSLMDAPGTYQIRIRGYLSPEWVKNLIKTGTVKTDTTRSPVESVIVGDVSNQAALLEIVNALYNWGFAVIAVDRLISQEQEVKPEGRT